MASNFKGSTHDPGWNDPPVFNYDQATAIQQAAASRKGPGLNKRVAFPMSGELPKSQILDPTAPPSLSSNIGKPPPCTVQLPPITTPVLITPNSINADETLSRVLKNLDVESCEENIVKRLDVMKQTWSTMELGVQTKLLDLSEAIVNKEWARADHIHKGLMVDHGHQCSTWMSAIRHIINRRMETASTNTTDTI